MHDAVLTGVETRTSSPIRITRGEDFQSLNMRGLYPAGEGAGYAGGILSAAVDGIKVGRSGGASASAAARAEAAQEKAARRRPGRQRGGVRLARSCSARDALFDRRVGGEQLADARVMPKASTLLGSSPGTMPPRRASALIIGCLRPMQLARPGVGAEFALAREPGHDDRGDEAQHDVEHDGGHVVADAGARALAAAAAGSCRPRSRSRATGTRRRCSSRPGSASWSPCRRWRCAPLRGRSRPRPLRASCPAAGRWTLKRFDRRRLEAGPSNVTRSLPFELRHRVRPSGGRRPPLAKEFFELESDA